MLKEEINNAITYEINKIKVVLFFWARRQELAKLLKTKLRIGKKTVYFKKKSLDN